MKSRSRIVLISVLLLSLCLVSRIPGSLKFVSTWRELYFDMGDFKQQNLLMPLGFYSLSIETVGLIVLWTGYRKRERSAWFVMLIIALGFGLPDIAIPISMQNGGNIQWSFWLGMRWLSDPLSRGFGLESHLSSDAGGSVASDQGVFLGIAKRNPRLKASGYLETRGLRNVQSREFPAVNSRLWLSATAL